VLTLPCSVRIFVSVEPTDMRCSFDRLAAMAQTILGQDPLSGHLFVFFNRYRDRCKILFWDRTGFCLWYKRLEEGVFRLPHHSSTKCFEMDLAKLTLILEGINLCSAHQQKRFSIRTDISS